MVYEDGHKWTWRFQNDHSKQEPSGRTRLLNYQKSSDLPQNIRHESFLAAKKLWMRYLTCSVPFFKSDFEIPTQKRFWTREIPRRISIILAFRMSRQPADADSVISIEYFSELLNDVSKNWELLALENFTSFSILIIIGIFSWYMDFQIFIHVI